METVRAHLEKFLLYFDSSLATTAEVCRAFIKLSLSLLSPVFEYKYITKTSSLEELLTPNRSYRFGMSNVYCLTAETAVFIFPLATFVLFKILKLFYTMRGHRGCTLN